MTDLRKPVRRRTVSTVRDGSTRRCIVASLEPGDILTLRLAGKRRVEVIPLTSCYFAAVRLRVAFEKAQKRKKK